MKTILKLGKGRVRVSLRRAKNGYRWRVRITGGAIYYTTKLEAVRGAIALHRGYKDTTYTVEPMPPL